MSATQTVNEACARIEAACSEIESAFEGTPYVFPTHGIACILAEAKREAQWINHEGTETPNTAAAQP